MPDLDGGTVTVTQLRYRPDVVVTYDELGSYDHPDHVHASRAAMALVARTGIPRKAYFTAFRRSRFERFRAVLEEQGPISRRSHSPIRSSCANSG